MNREKGFTLIELLMVVAIIGIITATAVPAYRTVRQRAVATEATTLLRHLLDAQTAYYLEYDKFFPENGKKSMDVFSNDDPAKKKTKKKIQQIKDALGITFPVGHSLNLHIQTFPKKADVSCTITISAPFPLFKDGTAQLTGFIHKDKGVMIF
jgi:prepilin-type N-terminal cleavage/methylation domain-containing protein